MRLIERLRVSWTVSRRYVRFVRTVQRRRRENARALKRSMSQDQLAAWVRQEWGQAPRYCITQPGIPSRAAATLHDVQRTYIGAHLGWFSTVTRVTRVGRSFRQLAA